jgi:hypothetical protein
MQPRRRLVSIEVQCPNPQCALVHRVKNRWAGRRGTCPACGSVIQVPGPAPVAPPGQEEPRLPAAGQNATQELRPQAMEFELTEAQLDVANLLPREVRDDRTEVLIGEGPGWDQAAVPNRPRRPLETTLADGDESLAPARVGPAVPRPPRAARSWRNPGAATWARPGLLWAIVLGLAGIVVLGAVLIFALWK